MGGVAIVEMLGAAVPAFSAMLFRDRLVESFRTQSPPLTLICAAAGYGKTVLASQFALHADFDAAIWVQLPDVDVSGESILRQVADALDQKRPKAEGLISEGVRALDSVALDDSVRIRDGLQGFRGSRVLLIIDGANALTAVHHVIALAGDLAHCTSPESRVVVSCRRVECECPVDPGIVWLVEEEDLAFTAAEVAALPPGRNDTEGELETQRLFNYCLGHPAITRILLRHGTPSPDARPRDLIWQTERIVSRLDETSLAALYLAAVLARGDVASLRRCALACDMKADWRALSRSVPLFHVFDTDPGARSFRVHAILCDVLERLARCVVTDDDRSCIRAVAFEQLSHDHDYVRLATALELHGTESEVAGACAQDGISMIRHAGHPAVARLLARLSPLSIASSARLLLLRSHVQRAEGMTSAALESAVMAKRVAEVNADKASLLVAALLITRLQFDRGLFDESREVLEEIEAQCNMDEDLAAHCLTQAYLAFFDGQAGRLRESVQRVGVLTELARQLDQGSDEAVFVANCVGAVACQCTGDWNAAAVVLGPIARRTDMAILQQMHARSNYAVALYELGDCREALLHAEAVLSMSSGLEFTSTHSYSAATLSDVLYALGDSERGRELDREALASFDRIGDCMGRAMHATNSARALRALGQFDESLSCVVGADAFLAGQGESAHMLHLMAQIEVAASHLALGDAIIAKQVVERILADPVITEALGHSLRCALILAEIDRMRGDSRGAVARLAQHAEYIASGSANMTLACYIRAFPGLLGLLDAALVGTGLPVRVVRLLTAGTMESAVVAATECFGAVAADRLSARYTIRGIEVTSSEARDSTADSPFLRVRTFGKLEVESPYGRVEHRHWRKRKSRLLFLMLLCAPAHEIPRDVILERLWPDMARSNAQRNLYVTWSHLRKALACEADQADIAQFADSNADAYWLTSLLRSDLDQFHTELGVLHVARTAGDGAAVIASATRIAEVYRGELLPIDIYDEWFEQDRTRARRDFCDAMVAGAQSAVDAQQYDSALVLLRRVSAIDPWREDVYQLMMRCQMFVGQRSGAIETYNVCRTRLVDDLGIDPCAETVRIFQAVLAMEEEGHFESSSEYG